MVDELKLFTVEYNFELCFYYKIMLEQTSVIEQHKSNAWHKYSGLRIIGILLKMLIVSPQRAHICAIHTTLGSVTSKYMAKAHALRLCQHY